MSAMEEELLWVLTGTFLVYVGFELAAYFFKNRK
jgi:hypothetical protein